MVGEVVVDLDVVCGGDVDDGNVGTGIDADRAPLEMASFLVEFVLDLAHCHTAGCESSWLGGTAMYVGVCHQDITTMCFFDHTIILNSTIATIPSYRHTITPLHRYITPAPYMTYHLTHNVYIVPLTRHHHSITPSPSRHDSITLSLHYAITSSLHHFTTP